MEYLADCGKYLLTPEEVDELELNPVVTWEELDDKRDHLQYVVRFINDMIPQQERPEHVQQLLVDQLDKHAHLLDGVEHALGRHMDGFEQQI